MNDLLTIKFPDKTFSRYMINHFDKDSDGEISLEEALKVEEINCSELKIESLDGIQFMPNLKSLYCSRNQIEKLDLSHNINLEYLSCYDNPLSELIIAGCEKLITIYTKYCNLKRIDLSTNLLLKTLSCSFNPLRTIDISRNKHLESLNVRRCNLSDIILCNNSNLRVLDCSENDIKLLELTHNDELTHLDCSINPNLKLIIIDSTYKIDKLYSDIQPMII